jgi:tRNA (mo5U34)-methyltransferase
MTGASADLPFRYDDFFARAAEAHPLWNRRDEVFALLRKAFGPGSHGGLPGWMAAVAALPPAVLASSDLAAGVSMDFAAPGPDAEALRAALMRLQPWRKGPFRFGEVFVDTEWRSDWKWDRVLPHLAPLAGRRILDVGCGSGYHLWRMRGAGASQVIGIDPTLLFLCQFQALQHYLREPAVQFLPVTLEAFPAATRAFDTVFSMGVLYHRRSPLDHLAELKSQLRNGGQLVLETLVVEGDARTVLTPADRYACMGNVWFIPSVETALLWLGKLGFRDARVVDVCATTTDEQRSTAWSGSHSLKDFLDPADPRLTVEGYPAPVRAVFIAEA